MKRAYSISLLLLGPLALLSCTGQGNGNGTPEAGIEIAADNVPAPIRDTAMRDIGSICTIDSINGKRPRHGTSFPPQAVATIHGWARIADGDQPLPPVVYLALRPQGTGGDQDVYMEMGRMPRPDQAGTDPAMEMIGFEGQAQLPGDGVYEARVWQGTAEWGTLCTVSGTITVQEYEEPARPLVPIMEGEQAQGAQAEGGRG